MVNREMLRGSWQEVCGKLREKWGELDEDQLERFEGRAKRLIGYIHRKTGEAEEKIEHYLDDILSELGPDAQRAARSTLQRAARTLRAARLRARFVARRLRESAERADDLIHERPRTTAGLAFGAGILAGVCLTAVLRFRNRGS